MHEMAPVIRVHNEPFQTLPKNLYIPDDALTISIDSFQGPLDLLLFLIKKQNFNILDIPIATISKQYAKYLNQIGILKLSLASEYLQMAALLAEIKSKQLLPVPQALEEETEDPRAALVEQLQAYDRIKRASEILDTLPRAYKDIFYPSINLPDVDLDNMSFSICSIKHLSSLFQSLQNKKGLEKPHTIALEKIDLESRMAIIFKQVELLKEVSFILLIDVAEGVLGVVVSFLSVLSLESANKIRLFQEGNSLILKLAG